MEPELIKSAQSPSWFPTLKFLKSGTEQQPCGSLNFKQNKAKKISNCLQGKTADMKTNVFLELLKTDAVSIQTHKYKTAP